MAFPDGFQQQPANGPPNSQGPPFLQQGSAAAAPLAVPEHNAPADVACHPQGVTLGGGQNKEAMTMLPWPMG